MSWHLINFWIFTLIILHFIKSNIDQWTMMIECLYHIIDISARTNQHLSDWHVAFIYQLWLSAISCWLGIVWIFTWKQWSISFDFHYQHSVCILTWPFYEFLSFCTSALFKPSLLIACTSQNTRKMLPVSAVALNAACWGTWREWQRMQT